MCVTGARSGAQNQPIRGPGWTRTELPPPLAKPFDQKRNDMNASLERCSVGLPSERVRVSVSVSSGVRVE